MTKKMFASMFCCVALFAFAVTAVAQDETAAPADAAVQAPVEDTGFAVDETVVGGGDCGCDGGTSFIGEGSVIMDGSGCGGCDDGFAGAGFGGGCGDGFVGAGFGGGCGDGFVGAGFGGGCGDGFGDAGCGGVVVSDPCSNPCPQPAPYCGPYVQKRGCFSFFRPQPRFFGFGGGFFNCRPACNPCCY